MLVGAMQLLKQDNSQEHKDLFYNELIKATFVCPVTIVPEPEIGPDGLAKLTPESQVNIPMLSRTDGRRYFMAYTDTKEMKKWSGDERQQVFALSYDDYANMVMLADNAVEGFVINPFTENLIITKKMVDTIRVLKSAGFETKK